MKKSVLAPSTSYWGERVVVPLVKADLPSLEDLKDDLSETLLNGRISNFGPHVLNLESKLKEYLGCEALTVSSGTQGLILSLQALGLKPGDKVLLPSFTFMASAQAILYAKGIPVFGEIDDNLLLSPQEIEKHLSKDSSIRCVLAVHMYGQVCDVKGIQAVIDSYSKKYKKKISLIYDAAHAFGSKSQDTLAGNFGDAEVFSLSATKPFVCIEGGLIASKNEMFLHQIKKMRNYGIDSNYNTKFPGMNGKMSEFNALVGLYNLARIENILKVREEKALAYAKMIHEKTIFKVFLAKPETRHTYKDFSILLPENLARKRNEIMDWLKQEGVETRAYFFPAVHEQDYFKSYLTQKLPKTESLSRRVLSVPFFTSISQEQIRIVVEKLSEVQKRFK